jgi:hypothetical protein
MKDMVKSDPKMALDVQKEFAKERMQAAAQEKKIKFSIQAFRKTLESRSGERSDEVKKMMWEGEWMEESKKAKYGYLGKEEAEQKWQQWMSDPSVAKDQNGPRGFTRLAIPHKTLLSGFSEVAAKKEFMQEEWLSRNAANATVAARVRIVVTDSANAEEEAIWCQAGRH